MWHKSDGDGVLDGAMARLLKVAVAAWVENIRGPECWDDNNSDQGLVDEVRGSWLDVAQAARMEHGQRLYAIATVAYALLDRRVTAPTLTADNEAMVYQIYRFLCHATDIEHDMLDDVQADPNENDVGFERLLMSTRNAIAAAAKELCPGCDDEDCDMCDLDMDAPPETWHAMVEGLADTVLWDRDWEMEGLFADSDPADADIAKALIGIDEGYFTTPTDEPSIWQVAQAKAYLESIADEIRIEDEATAGV